MEAPNSTLVSWRLLLIEVQKKNFLNAFPGKADLVRRDNRSVQG
jgi:hypothetical protein